jgi:acyl carrier protein
LSDDIETVIREYVEGSALLRRPGPPTNSTTPGSAGALDSLAIIELVLFLETRFGIEFSSRDLDRRRLETVEQIERLVAEKLNALTGLAQTEVPEA